MDLDPRCAVCSSLDWLTLGSRTYSADEMSRLSSYRRARYDVLFEVWMPGSRAATFHSLLCRNCGFVQFSPRPTAADLTAKYEYLANHPDSRHEMTGELTSDRVRSQQLFEYLEGFIGPHQRRLLDYGGGNGRLLGSFLQAGYQCSVVDYIKQTLPGITRLASTIEDVPVNCNFDVIVCSHVLEHLAEPRKVLERLVRLLANDGLIYLEVPLEIWDGLPLPPEPVTHINFFTPGSLRYLCQGLAVDVLECGESTFVTESGDLAPCVRLIARKGAMSADIRPGEMPWRETMRYVAPSLAGKVRRYARYPAMRRAAARNLIRRVLPRTFFWRFFD